MAPLPLRPQWPVWDRSSHRLLPRSLWPLLRRLVWVLSRRSVWRHQASFHCNSLPHNRPGSLSANRAAQRRKDAASAESQDGMPARPPMVPPRHGLRRTLDKAGAKFRIGGSGTGGRTHTDATNPRSRSTPAGVLREPAPSGLSTPTSREVSVRAVASGSRPHKLHIRLAVGRGVGGRARGAAASSVHHAPRLRVHRGLLLERPGARVGSVCVRQSALLALRPHRPRPTSASNTTGRRQPWSRQRVELPTRCRLWGPSTAGPKFDRPISARKGARTTWASDDVPLFPLRFWPWWQSSRSRRDSPDLGTSRLRDQIRSRKRDHCKHPSPGPRFRAQRRLIELRADPNRRIQAMILIKHK